jgi:outer membrane protein assembly factor BamD
MKKYISFVVVIAAIIVFVSCKSTNRMEEKTPETMYDKAMQKFKDEDWMEASQLLEVIKLQYGASQYADDAQYYIAEINYKKSEFILAAYNFNSLRRTYPTSPYFKIALYKAGMCYFELSPPFDRDQEYTLKAIEVFQDYQRLYPGDSLYDKSSEMIDELRNKLARREYETAILYEKLYSPKSSLVYFDAVINEYPDSKFYEDAYFSKIRILDLMGKNEEVKSAIRQFKDLFAKGKYINEVLAIERKFNQ